MPAKRRVARQNNTSNVQKKNEPPQKVVTIQVSFIVSTGRDDTRSLDELAEDLRQQMLAQGAKNVTRVQGYYLVNGRVCLKDDYDPETKDFLPGRRPPLWASSPDEQKILARIDREAGYDKLSRNPPHLRTAKETKELKEMEARKSRVETPGAAMADFYENTERGREIMAERNARIEESRKSASEVVDVDDDVEEFDDDETCSQCGEIDDECECLLVEEFDDEDMEEFDDDEDGVDVEDINDMGKMSDAVDDLADKALTKIRRVVRK